MLVVLPVAGVPSTKKVVASGFHSDPERRCVERTLLVNETVQRLQLLGGPEG
jgi:hypothetical protein